MEDWIPTEKELPEPMTEVFIAQANNATYPAYYVGEDSWMSRGGFVIPTPTDWMPMPSPPNRGNNND